MLINRRSRVLVLFISLTLAASAAWAGGGESKRSADESIFSEAIYLRDVGHLASDELEGRGTGQPGNDVAAEYIAQQFKDAGVLPAGDKGTYFQNFTLKLKSKIGDNTKLTYAVKDRRTYKTAAPGEDYTPLPFSDNGPFSGEVVFAGYGIEDEDLEYDDFKGVNVEGKVVLVLRRAPKFDEFSPRAMSFMAKAQLAASHDAAALLVVNPIDDEDGDKLYSMESGGGRRGGFGFDMNSIPILQIKQELADELLKAGGLEGLAAVQKKIEAGKKPASAALKGVRVKGNCDVQQVDSPCRNVVGMIPGSGPQKDEIIIIGGHYDHLGIRNKGDAKFNPLKDISNGADDNASGSTGVIMLARAFAKNPPNRSMLVMAFTGEELGLLGSQHFAKNPTVDLKKCVAMLNFDMIGRLKDDKLEIGGMRTGGFEEMSKKLAEPFGFKIVDGGGGRGPSDHTSFYNKNIPVLFYFTGIHKQYHQPEDDTPLLNIAGAVNICRYAANVIEAIDANPERPVFKADTTRETLLTQDAPEKPAAPLAGPARPGVRLGVVPGEGGEKGLAVMEVQDDTAASRAGVKAGDRIMKIGDAKITDRPSLLAVLAKMKPDDKTTIVVNRDGRDVKLSVGFGEPAAVVAAKPSTPAAAPRPAAAPSSTATASVTARRLQALLNSEPAQGEGHDAASMCKYRVVDDQMSIVVWPTDSPAFDGWIRNQSRAQVVDAVGKFLAGAHGCDTTIEYGDAIAHRDRPPSTMNITLRRNSGSTFSGVGKSTDASAPHTTHPQASVQPAAHATRVAGGGQSPHGQAAAHGHESGDGDDAPKMPPVRLGIMPTYTPGDGEGYEISGVAENGPAAKAGMKDSDRILRIGSKKVTDVYSYMASLMECRPNQVIEVEVLREGKRLVLKVKCDAQKPAEPS